MIDYIKIEITNSDLIESVSQNSLLEYDKITEKANNNTGEVYKIHYQVFKKLKFVTITDSFNKPEKMYISGSLHYYFNGGVHNANDFTFHNFLEVLNDLNTKFNINFKESIIRSLEYGINFKPDKYRTNKILQNIFYHKRRKFTEPIGKPYRQFGDIRQHEYILKIYNKAFQFPNYTEGELMRFEIRYTRMRELRKIGISNLSDLLEIENHLKLHNILLKRFEELLIFDFTIRTKKLTPAKRENVTNYSNINYWENLNVKVLNDVKYRNNFYYHKNGLKSIVLNESDQLQNKLSHIIDYKGINLLNLLKYKGLEKVKCMAYPPIKSEKFCMAHPPLDIWGKGIKKTELLT